MLNLNKVGRPLAKIIGGKLDKKVVSVFTDGEDEEKISKTFNSLKLEKGSKFQQITDEDAERFIGYITGPSGSGKSTYIKNLCKEILKIRKKTNIYLFSAKNEDESLDDIGLKRIKIDNSLIEDPLSIEEFERGDIVLFDDVDVIGNKAHREAVYTLLNQILEIGRSYGINAIYTHHLPTGGKDTRRILNECHWTVFFPHSGSTHGLKYLLEKYVGLDKNELKKIKKMNSRWCCIFKNYPQVIMTENVIYCPASNDD
jgi:hypothetical protein